MEPIFFASPAEFRAWLEENHDKASELLVGYYKVGSGRPSMTWAQSVDEALCFGWIDGIRKGIDQVSYTIRFTPRRRGSTWSDVNIKRVQELTKLGLMHDTGQKAFELRKQDNSGVYSYEQRHEAKLDEAYEQEFRVNDKAWEYFQARPPSYRQSVIYWVMSAKQEATKLRRLAALIEHSENGRMVPALTSPYRREAS
jgi:uncharacterized protein YdeI (YjbR/CyaY-like superfamily)